MLHEHVLRIWTTLPPVLFIEEKNSESVSRSVVSDSLWPHGLRHARLPCPSPSTGACSNSCPSSWWCHPTISSSVTCCLLLLPPSIFLNIRVFSNESALSSRWPKYWSFSFSINPSNEYSGLISFRIYWFDLPAVKGTPKSSPAPQFESINSSALSLFMVQLSHLYRLLERS